MKPLVLFALLSFAAFSQGLPPAIPAVFWDNPADIRYPAPLSATQLTATANVPGSFVYTPPIGTVLQPGADQSLNVTFTPADGSDPLTATVKIKVLTEWEPFGEPVATTVCQMENLTTPAVDWQTQLPRCFVVPQKVSHAMTKFLISQTSVGADGKTVYKYANWWDYVVKFFLTQMVLPALDSFPPDDLAAMKATAEAAAKAVDAAKAAILSGQQQ